MKYFHKVLDIPCLDLEKTLNNLLIDNLIKWPASRQICLNSTYENSYDYEEGAGSLDYDWDKKYAIKDESGNEKIIVPERKFKPKEKDFIYLCNQFKGTNIQEIYDILKTKYILGRVRFMLIKPKTCLSWHIDHSDRLHYPIKTQKGCFMNIDGEVKEMPRYEWYLTKTTNEHTAVNASKEDRIHLVACILGYK